MSAARSIFETLPCPSGRALDLRDAPLPEPELGGQLHLRLADRLADVAKAQARHGDLELGVDLVLHMLGQLGLELLPSLEAVLAVRTRCSPFTHR